MRRRQVMERMCSRSLDRWPVRAGRGALLGVLALFKCRSQAPLHSGPGPGERGALSAAGGKAGELKMNASGLAETTQEILSEIRKLRMFDHCSSQISDGILSQLQKAPYCTCEQQRLATEQTTKSRGMIMKTLLSALLALSVLTAAAASASAFDAKTFYQEQDRSRY
jgi:hypothetical protein